MKIQKSQFKIQNYFTPLKRTTSPFTYIFFFIVASLLFFTHSHSVFAQEQKQPQETTTQAVVTQVIEDKRILVEGKNQRYQKLKLEITQGDEKGKMVIVEIGKIPVINQPYYKVGDTVIMQVSPGPTGTKEYFITDFVRETPLALLVFIFIILAIGVGRLRGFTSLLGMGFSFLVLFLFILPQILQGNDPVLITIIASCLIIPMTYYLSHGLSGKTTAAIIGTVIALIITGIFAMSMVSLLHLTGYASEEATYLQAARPDLTNIQGLLLAGIIISVLGILNDITISQAAIVYQLKEASHTPHFASLYTRAMNIGRDHIASTVNTLILVYTGAALPLLLLFVASPKPFSEIISYEPLAEEIARTLIASCGLILAVPLTTLIACLFVRRK